MKTMMPMRIGAFLLAVILCLSLFSTAVFAENEAAEPVSEPAPVAELAPAPVPAAEPVPAQEPAPPADPAPVQEPAPTNEVPAQEPDVDTELTVEMTATSETTLQSKEQPTQDPAEDAIPAASPAQANTSVPEGQQSDAEVFQDIQNQDSETPIEAQGPEEGETPEEQPKEEENKGPFTVTYKAVGGGKIYNLYGGTTTQYDDRPIEKGGYITGSTAFAPDGYSFDGWFYENGGLITDQLCLDAGMVGAVNGNLVLVATFHSVQPSVKDVEKEPAETEELVEIEDYETPLGIGGLTGSVLSKDVAETRKKSEEEETEELGTALTVGETPVRVEADGLAPINMVLEEGSEITVLDLEGDWLKVLLEDGRIGYIYKNNLNENDLAAIQEALSEEEAEDAAFTKGEEIPKKVTIFTSRRAIMEEGETIQLTSILEGFEDCEEIVYIWKVDKGAGFEEVEGANGATHSFEATAESLSWGWYLSVQYC